MATYLEIAMRAVSAAQPGPSEPTPGDGTSTRRMVKADERSKELPPCGSPDCAGCYDVGDRRKIHPPKIGDDCKKWLEHW
jgi:hypothetical protein